MLTHRPVWITTAVGSRVCDSIDLAEHVSARAEQPQIRPRLMRAISNGGGAIRICQADFNQAAQTG